MDSAYCLYTRIGWPSWDERENHISVQEECSCGIGGIVCEDNEKQHTKNGLLYSEGNITVDQCPLNSM